MDTTLCWKCSKPYPIEAEKCPHCEAANANVDYEKAKLEELQESEMNP